MRQAIEYKLSFCCHARFKVLLLWRHLSEVWHPLPNLFRDRTLQLHSCTEGT